ncbi:MAG: sensor histidine kinase [Bacteroidota bacterium]
MIKCLFFLPIALIPFLLSAQTAKDSSELQLLADSAYNLLFTDIPAGRQLAEEVIERAKEKGMKAFEFNALQTVGYSFYFNYEFEQALEIFFQGLKETQEHQREKDQSPFHNAIGIVYEQQAKYTESIHHYRQSLQIERQTNDSASIGRALGNLANVYENLGKVDSAIGMQKEAIMIREKKKTDAIHNNYNGLGVIYHRMGRYDLAIEYYVKAATKRNELGEHLLEAYTYNNLGVLFTDLKNHEKCMLYLKKAENIYEDLAKPRELAQTLSSLGTEFQRIYEFDKADSLFRKAIAMHKEINNRYSEALDYHNLGALYTDWNQLDSSIFYYQKARKLKEEDQNEQGLVITLVELGNALSRKFNGKQGKALMLRGEVMAKEQANLRQVQNVTEKLGEHYERIGDLQLALDYQKKSNVLKDSLFNEDYIDKMNQLYVAFETQQTKGQLLEEQVKAQKLEKEKADADLTVAQRTTQLAIAIGSLLLILLGGGFVIYRRRQQEKETIAQVKIAEQQKGLAAVIQAQEEERKRIAKDLHDGIVQQLGGLKLGLQKVLSSNRDSDAKKMIRILDDSTQELRELSHQMMPRALSELGLIPALEDMLENSLAHSPITYHFETFGIQQTDRFKESIEISLYRIVQELINNVIKHSGASEVNIQLLKTTANLALIVEDNGKGFKQSPSKSGIGLMNISSRLDTINGQVNYEASPEGGTLATIHIPLTS